MHWIIYRHVGWTGLGWIDGQKSPVFRRGKPDSPGYYTVSVCPINKPNVTWDWIHLKRWCSVAQCDRQTDRQILCPPVRPCLSSSSLTAHLIAPDSVNTFYMTSSCSSAWSHPVEEDALGSVGLIVSTRLVPADRHITAVSRLHSFVRSSVITHSIQITSLAAGSLTADNNSMYD